MKSIEKIADMIARKLSSDEERQRLQRAVEALVADQMTVVKLDDGYEVRNGASNRTYKVWHDGQWHCTCPDAEKRNIRCKHIFAAYIAEKTGMLKSADQPQAPEAAPAQEAAGAQAPQGAEEADPVMPFGRHKGKRLSEILATAPDDLLWIVRKMEARSDADRALKEAAAALVEKAARERAEAILNGQGEMPTLPFGEEKGKPIDKAHPKWVAILAKKTVQDAFTFADAVLYEVARRLHEARQEARKQNASRSRSLDIEAFREAVREAVREGILAALQEAQRVIWDREGLLAELGQLRERIEAIERNGMDAVAFRFALEELQALEEEKRENELAKEERYRRLTRSPRRLVR